MKNCVTHRKTLSVILILLLMMLITCRYINNRLLSSKSVSTQQITVLADRLVQKNESTSILGYKEVDVLRPRTHINFSQTSHHLIGYEGEFANVAYGIDIPGGSWVQGKPLKVPREIYHRMMNVTHFVDLNRDNVKDFVIVTGADKKYFQPVLATIRSVQRHFPNYTVIFYDLGGLKPGQIEMVKGLCNVKYRLFNFDKYPSHVKYLRNYAFKELLIYELLLEYTGILWIDSSIRINTTLSDIPGEFFNEALSTQGFLFLRTTHYSLFSQTEKSMWDYLPTDREVMKVLDNHAGGSMLIFRTRVLWENVLRWVFMCAADGRCAEPTRKLSCSFRESDKEKYGDCHRFDMCTINTLFQNWVGYHQSIGMAPHPYILVVNRGGGGDTPEMKIPPSVC